MADLDTVQIVLASASPRRGELLRQIGIAFETFPVDIDESYQNGETATGHAMRLAMTKAVTAHTALAQKANALPVLGADTVVEIDGDVLGKPSDYEQAQTMLSRLSGKQHHVHTAVAVVTDNDRVSAVCSSAVVFAELDEAVVRQYINTGEPFDKAGGYGIQGIAGQFVRSIEGSYSGIKGLPLYETAQLLTACGVQTLNKPGQTK